LEQSESYRDLTAHEMTDHIDAVDRELVKDRRSKLSLPQYRIAGSCGCGTTMFDQIETNDSMIGGERRSDRVSLS
jgi:hypothetical protein